MFKKILRILASLNLAVIIIVILIVIFAAGTIVESRFNDARMAQVLVFHAWYTWGTLIFLAINLLAVMVDRWPWRSHHAGFILAHVGIILLLIGSAITYFYGVDGSMRFSVGGKSSHITVPETDVVVYASMDGDSFTKVFEKEVHFLKQSPSEASPFVVPLPREDIKVVDYIPYALMETKITSVEKKTEGEEVRGEGAAIRFQLSNQHVNLTKWIFSKGGKKESLNLGPASVTLVRLPQGPSYADWRSVCRRVNQKRISGYVPKGRNEIVLYSFNRLLDNSTVNNSATDKRLCYGIYSKNLRTGVKKGVIAPGDSIETGWMGLKLRLFKYFPNAKEGVNVRAMGQLSELTSPAVKIQFKGKEHWLAMNSILRVFDNETAYIFFYQNRRLQIDFQINLKEFEVGRYQGTMRAASYQSLITIDGELGETLISMNEPLKHGGFTFYQASFESDEQGQPVASILSVNYDPGRFLKYLGSLLIVLGIILMFYFKKIIVQNWKRRHSV